MENIRVEATDRSPELDFNFHNNVFAMRGESYPEDTSAFFATPIHQFREHLENLDGASLSFNFELIYFNSSSAKVLMGIFDALDEAAAGGSKITITWTCDSDDEHMEEMGEDFAEDLEHAKFELIKIDT